MTTDADRKKAEEIWDILNSKPVADGTHKSIRSIEAHELMAEFFSCALYRRYLMFDDLARSYLKRGEKNARLTAAMEKAQSALRELVECNPFGIHSIIEHAREALATIEEAMI